MNCLDCSRHLMISSHLAASISPNPVEQFCNKAPVGSGDLEIFQHMSHLKNAQRTEEKMQHGLGSAPCCFISPPPTATLPPAKHNSSIRTGKLAENIIPTIRNQRRRLKCWQCRILACIYSHLVQHAQMPNHWVSLTRCSSRMSHLLSAAPTLVVTLRNLTAAQKSGPYIVIDFLLTWFLTIFGSISSL